MVNVVAWGPKVVEVIDLMVDLQLMAELDRCGSLLMDRWWNKRVADEPGRTLFSPEISEENKRSQRRALLFCLPLTPISFSGSIHLSRIEDFLFFSKSGFVHTPEMFASQRDT